MRPNAKKKIVRSSAAIVVFCFSVTTVAWSAPILPKPEIILPSLADQIDLPERLGAIRERFIPENRPSQRHYLHSPVVVHIQDAHANYEAQTNINKIVKHLNREYGFKLLFAEGGVGKFDPRLLQFFNVPAQNQSTAEQLAKDGIVSGTELFMLEQLQAGKASAAAVEALGVEDPELFRQNLEAFRENLKRQKKIQPLWDHLKTAILTAGSRHFNKKLKTFFDEWIFYQDLPSEVLSHLRVLQSYALSELRLDFSNPREQLDWPQLVRIAKVKNLELKLNPDQARAERLNLAEWIRSVKGPDEFRTFLNDFENPDSKRKEIRSYFERFYDVLRPAGFSFENYPELTRQIGLMILNEELDSQVLLAEMNRLSERLLDHLTKSNKEKQLVSLYKDWQRMKRLFALELVREDFNLISNRKWELQPSQWLRRFEALNAADVKVCKSYPSCARQFDSLYFNALDFYRGAERREEAIFDHMIRGMQEKKIPNAILITGGFHSEGLLKRMKERGIAYVEVTPHIKELAEDGNYKRIMSLEGDLLTLRSHIPFAPWTSPPLEADLYSDEVDDFLAGAVLASVTDRIRTEGPSLKKGAYYEKAFMDLNGSYGFKKSGLSLQTISGNRRVLMLENEGAAARPVRYHEGILGVTSDGKLSTFQISPRSDAEAAERFQFAGQHRFADDLKIKVRQLAAARAEVRNDPYDLPEPPEEKPSENAKPKSPLWVRVLIVGALIAGSIFGTHLIKEKFGNPKKGPFFDEIHLPMPVPRTQKEKDKVRAPLIEEDEPVNRQDKPGEKGSKQAEESAAKAAWRFAPRYSREDLLGKPDMAARYMRDFVFWESKFHQPGIGYNAESGLTYDGHAVDSKTGELLGGARNWSASSKESLHLSMLLLAILGDEYARLFISPQNPAAAEKIAVEVLTKKISSYERFNRDYPGFGGFLPWFLVSDQGLRPTDDWQDRVPGLDNGQLAWSLYAASYALQEKGHAELARRYRAYFDLMKKNAVKVFYDGNGRIRAEAKINNTQQSNPSANNFSNNAADYFLDDPYEGELMIFLISLFGELSPKEIEKIWDIKRKKFEAVEFATPQGILTAPRGHWMSGHEPWKFLKLPYVDVPVARDVFVNGEKARTWYSHMNKKPGAGASMTDTEPQTRARGVRDEYLSAVGIPPLARVPVQYTNVSAPYAQFSNFIAHFAIAGPMGVPAAWLDATLDGPRVQTPYGVIEGVRDDGTGATYLLSWDGKVTLVLAMSNKGGIHSVVAQALKQDNKYQAFYDRVEKEHQLAFPQIKGKDIPFATPNAMIPMGMPDYVLVQADGVVNLLGGTPFQGEGELFTGHRFQKDVLSLPGANGYLWTRTSRFDAAKTPFINFEVNTPGGRVSFEVKNIADKLITLDKTAIIFPDTKGKSLVYSINVSKQPMAEKNRTAGIVVFSDLESPAIFRGITVTPELPNGSQELTWDGGRFLPGGKEAGAQRPANAQEQLWQGIDFLKAANVNLDDEKRFQLKRDKDFVQLGASGGFGWWQLAKQGQVNLTEKPILVAEVTGGVTVWMEIKNAANEQIIGKQGRFNVSKAQLQFTADKEKHLVAIDLSKSFRAGIKDRTARIIALSDASGGTANFYRIGFISREELKVFNVKAIDPLIASLPSTPGVLDTYLVGRSEVRLAKKQEGVGYSVVKGLVESAITAGLFLTAVKIVASATPYLALAVAGAGILLYVSRVKAARKEGFLSTHSFPVVEMASGMLITLMAPALSFILIGSVFSPLGLLISLGVPALIYAAQDRYNKWTLALDFEKIARVEEEARIEVSQPNTQNRDYLSRLYQYLQVGSAKHTALFLNSIAQELKQGTHKAGDTRWTLGDAATLVRIIAALIQQSPHLGMDGERDLLTVAGAYYAWLGKILTAAKPGTNGRKEVVEFLLPIRAALYERVRRTLIKLNDANDPRGRAHAREYLNMLMMQHIPPGNKKAGKFIEKAVDFARFDPRTNTVVWKEGHQVSTYLIGFDTLGNRLHFGPKVLNFAFGMSYGGTYTRWGEMQVRKKYGVETPKMPASFALAYAPAPKKGVSFESAKIAAGSTLADAPAASVLTKVDLATALTAVVIPVEDFKAGVLEKARDYYVSKELGENKAPEILANGFARSIIKNLGSIYEARLKTSLQKMPQPALMRKSAADLERIQEAVQELIEKMFPEGAELQTATPERKQVLDFYTHLKEALGTQDAARQPALMAALITARNTSPIPATAQTTPAKKRSPALAARSELRNDTKNDFVIEDSVTDEKLVAELEAFARQAEDMAARIESSDEIRVQEGLKAIDEFVARFREITDAFTAIMVSAASRKDKKRLENVLKRLKILFDSEKRINLALQTVAERDLKNEIVKRGSPILAARNKMREIQGSHGEVVIAAGIANSYFSVTDPSFAQLFHAWIKQLILPRSEIRLSLGAESPRGGANQLSRAEVRANQSDLSPLGSGRELAPGQEIQFHYESPIRLVNVGPREDVFEGYLTLDGDFVYDLISDEPGEAFGQPAQSFPVRKRIPANQVPPEKQSNFDVQALSDDGIRHVIKVTNLSDSSFRVEANPAEQYRGALFTKVVTYLPLTREDVTEIKNISQRPADKKYPIDDPIMSWVAKQSPAKYTLKIEAGDTVFLDARDNVWHGMASPKDLAILAKTEDVPEKAPPVMMRIRVNVTGDTYENADRFVSAVNALFRRFGIFALRLTSDPAKSPVIRYYRSKDIVEIPFWYTALPERLWSANQVEEVKVKEAKWDADFGKIFPLRGEMPGSERSEIRAEARFVELAEAAVRQGVLSAAALENIRSWARPAYRRVQTQLTKEFERASEETDPKKHKELWTEIDNAWYTKAAPGTAGMRGKLGLGTNRISEYTVGLFQLAHALAVASPEYNKIVEQQDPDFDPSVERKAVVLGGDSRHQSYDPAEKMPGKLIKLEALLNVVNGTRAYVYRVPVSTPQVAWSVHGLDIRPVIYRLLEWLADSLWAGWFANRLLTAYLLFIKVDRIVSGSMNTASHNPRTDNGNKPYKPDGSQSTGEFAAHLNKKFAEATPELLDTLEYDGLNILDHIDLAFDRALEKGDILWVGGDNDSFLADEQFIKFELEEAIYTKDRIFDPDQVALQDIKIVISPLYGVSRHILEKMLRLRGLRDDQIVWVESEPNPDFPGIKGGKPNPEEPQARSQALAKAHEVDADLILWTDPDADRPAVAFKTEPGEYLSLNGNQQLALITDYLIRELRGLAKEERAAEDPRKSALVRQAVNIVNRLDRAFMASTVVSGDLMKVIARNAGLEVVETLTGFKYIGDEIEKRAKTIQRAAKVSERQWRELSKEEKIRISLQNSELFLFGGEESLGSLTSDGPHDKDGITGVMWFVEIAGRLRKQGILPSERLNEIYQTYGYFAEGFPLLTLGKEYGQGDQKRTFSEAEAMQIIKAQDDKPSILGKLRKEPPQEIAGKKVIAILDFDAQRAVDNAGRLLFDVNSQAGLVTPETQGIPEAFAAALIRIPVPENSTISVARKHFLQGIYSFRHQGVRQSTGFFKDWEALPRENFVTLLLEDGSKVIVRPSGTEPVIKFYINARTVLKEGEDIEVEKNRVDDWINRTQEFLTGYAAEVAEKRFPRSEVRMLREKKPLRDTAFFTVQKIQVAFARMQKMLSPGAEETTNFLAAQLDKLKKSNEYFKQNRMALAWQLHREVLTAVRDTKLLPDQIRPFLLRESGSSPHAFWDAWRFIHENLVPTLKALTHLHYAELQHLITQLVFLKMDLLSLEEMKIKKANTFFWETILLQLKTEYSALTYAVATVVKEKNKEEINLRVKDLLALVRAEREIKKAFEKSIEHLAEHDNPALLEGLKESLKAIELLESRSHRPAIMAVMQGHSDFQRDDADYANELAEMARQIAGRSVPRGTVERQDHEIEARSRADLPSEGHSSKATGPANGPEQSRRAEVRMLILSRKAGESLLIGDDIQMNVLKIRDNEVSIGIIAPDKEIIRPEVDEIGGHALSDRGAMLVLTRNKRESLEIGKDIKITVLEIRSGQRVRLGLTAPMDVPIFRKEMMDKIKNEKKVPESAVLNNFEELKEFTRTRSSQYPMDSVTIEYGPISSSTWRLTPGQAVPELIKLAEKNENRELFQFPLKATLVQTPVTSGAQTPSYNLRLRNLSRAEMRGTTGQGKGIYRVVVADALQAARGEKALSYRDSLVNFTARWFNLKDRTEQSLIEKVEDPDTLLEKIRGAAAAKNPFDLVVLDAILVGGKDHNELTELLRKIRSASPYTWIFVSNRLSLPVNNESFDALGVFLSFEDMIDRTEFVRALERLDIYLSTRPEARSEVRTFAKDSFVSDETPISPHDTMYLEIQKPFRLLLRNGKRGDLQQESGLGDFQLKEGKLFSLNSGRNDLPDIPLIGEGDLLIRNNVVIAIRQGRVHVTNHNQSATLHVIPIRSEVRTVFETETLWRIGRLTDTQNSTEDRARAASGLGDSLSSATRIVNGSFSNLKSKAIEALEAVWNEENLERFLRFDVEWALNKIDPAVYSPPARIHANGKLVSGDGLDALLVKQVRLSQSEALNNEDGSGQRAEVRNVDDFQNYLRKHQLKAEAVWGKQIFVRKEGSNPFTDEDKWDLFNLKKFGLRFKSWGEASQTTAWFYDPEGSIYNSLLRAEVRSGESKGAKENPIENLSELLTLMIQRKHLDLEEAKEISRDAEGFYKNNPKKGNEELDLWIKHAELGLIHIEKTFQEVVLKIYGTSASVERKRSGKAKWLAASGVMAGLSAVILSLVFTFFRPWEQPQPITQTPVVPTKIEQEPKDTRAPPGTEKGTEPLAKKTAEKQPPVKEDPFPKDKKERDEAAEQVEFIRLIEVLKDPSIEKQLKDVAARGLIERGQKNTARVMKELLQYIENTPTTGLEKVDIEKDRFYQAISDIFVKIGQPAVPFLAETIQITDGRTYRADYAAKALETLAPKELGLAPFSREDRNNFFRTYVETGTGRLENGLKNSSKYGIITIREKDWKANSWVGTGASEVTGLKISGEYQIAEMEVYLSKGGFFRWEVFGLIPDFSNIPASRWVPVQVILPKMDPKEERRIGTFNLSTIGSGDKDKSEPTEVRLKNFRVYHYDDSQWRNRKDAIRIDLSKRSEVRAEKYGDRVNIYPDRDSMGKAAAELGIRKIKELLKERENEPDEKNRKVRIVFAAAPSQVETIKWLVDLSKGQFDWRKIEFFHMDEFAGYTEDSQPINGQDPPSFRYWLSKNLIQPIVEKHGIPREELDIHFIPANSRDKAELQKAADDYGKHLGGKPVDIVFGGYGYNGHVAFNDPPADFTTADKVIVVDPASDPVNKKQQIDDYGEFFKSEQDIPLAVTISMPAMKDAKYLIMSVPGKFKAEAVKAIHRLTDEGKTPAPDPMIPGTDFNTLSADRIQVFTDEAGASLLPARSEVRQFEIEIDPSKAAKGMTVEQYLRQTFGTLKTLAELEIQLIFKEGGIRAGSFEQVKNYPIDKLSGVRGISPVNRFDGGSARSDVRGVDRKEYGEVLDLFDQKKDIDIDWSKLEKEFSSSQLSDLMIYVKSKAETSNPEDRAFFWQSYTRLQSYLGSRSEVRSPSQDSLTKQLREEFDYLPVTLEPLIKVAFAAEQTISHQYAAFDRKLAGRLLDLVIPQAGEAVQAPPADFEKVRAEVMREMEFLDALLNDQNFRRRFGLPEFASNGAGQVILSTEGDWQKKLPVLIAALPLFAAFTPRQSSTQAVPYRFAGDPAHTRELKNKVLSANNGLSEVDRSRVSSILYFDIQRTFAEAVSHVLQSKNQQSGLVALAGHTDRSNLSIEILQAIEKPSDFEGSTLNLTDKAVSYFYRARLLQDLAAQVQERRIEAQKLGRNLGDTYWKHFVSVFFQKNLPDVVVNIHDNGSFDLSLSLVQRQLDIYRTAHAELSKAA